MKLSDIEIAHNAKIEPIGIIAEKLLGHECDLAYEDIGGKMAKLPIGLIDEGKIKSSKLILVTSISPTKAGIGKTTVSVGLNDALRTIGKKSVAVLREPSLGPCFGMKGGACGGGYSQVIPMEKINLHFTGDFHAITTANNLIAAAVDNYFYHNPSEFGKIKKITFRRCLDMNDRSLRNIYTKDSHGNLIATGFDITPASEIMAIFCLATDIDDLRRRIDNIIIAEYNDGSFMYCSMLGITGSIVALLSDAMNPNLVQSLEHNPVIIHGGPFANIAHGCNTVIATKMGLSLADIVVTEAGFGSDLGAEKFWDIKCRTAGLKPDVVILVVTIRGIKNQGGSISLENEDFTAFNIGLQNLKQHVNNLRKQGHKVIVTNNSFDTDTEKEQDALETYCMKELGVKCIKNTCFASGGLGAVKLACAVDDLIHKTETTQSFVYELQDNIKTKINKIAANVYGLNTNNISYSKQAEKFIREHADDKFSNYPICIAKTQYSFADDPNVVLPVPTKDTPFHIDEIKINNGAGFLVVIAGEMMRMPGLPKKPAAMTIDYKDGEIVGLS